MRGAPLSEEARARLAELDAAGRSATQIAEVLGNEFGVYKTRNAIIGLIHRMGLRKTRESRANKPAPVPPVKKQSRHSGRPEGGRPLRPAPVKAPTPPVMGNPITPAPSGSVGLLDLEHHHCRAIVGRGTDGLATFCGAPKSAGSYCAAHAHMFYVQPSTRKADPDYLAGGKWVDRMRGGYDQRRPVDAFFGSQV